MLKIFITNPSELLQSIYGSRQRKNCSWQTLIWMSTEGCGFTTVFRLKDLSRLSTASLGDKNMADTNSCGSLDNIKGSWCSICRARIQWNVHREQTRQRTLSGNCSSLHTSVSLKHLSRQWWNCPCSYIGISQNSARKLCPGLMQS